MKLVYLWIDEYKTLKKQAIDLSCEYKVNREGKKFIVKKEPRLPKPDFYFPLEKVTAIIGKNGAGKSSILEVLMALLNGLEAYLYEKNFLIIEWEGTLYTVGDAENVFYQGHVVESVGWNKSIANVIYYSPIYSPHNVVYKKHSGGIKDVSNNMVYSRTISINARKDIKDQFDFLSSYEEFSRKHLSFNKYFKVDLPKPSTNPFKLKFKSFLRSKHIGLRDELLGNVRKFLGSSIGARELEVLFNSYGSAKATDRSRANMELDEFFDRLDFEIEDVFFKSPVRKQLEMSFTYQLLIKKLTHPGKKGGFSAPKGADKETFSFSLVLFFLVTRGLMNLEVIRKQEWNSLFGDINSWEDFSNEIGKVFEDSYSLGRFVDKIFQREVNFPLSFNTGQSLEALNIVKEVQRSKYADYGITVSWNGMSSGQIAKLNLFSRINRGLNEKSKTDRILLLLDEADIYLHPEWQRTFLSELQKFLQDVPGNNTFELIITSHSPLMISDLENEDVYIVDRNPVQDFSRVTNVDEETFGSNIHSLYAHGFLLENTVGEIACEQINKLQRSIENAIEPSESQIVEWFQRVRKIGEPVVKRGIENLISSKIKNKNKMKDYYFSEYQRLSKGSH